MNLTESLREALPELPAGRVRPRLPRLHPDLIFRNNVEDGEPIVAAMIRGSDKILRFSLPQWQLIELFDGVRPFEEIAQTYADRYGVLYEVADLQEFVANLETTGIWSGSSRTQHTHRHAPTRSRWADISHIQFSVWDPDRYFDRIYPRLRWIYTRWFTTVTLLAFAFELWIWMANWNRLFADNLAYFNFANKSAGDLQEFWFLFLIIGFVHESAHGLTCKHYGGQVHQMGLHLIYLTPAFFVDVTEAWVYAGRWQRLTIIIAGIWSELILGAIASFIWWGTPAGSTVHDLAYKMVLLNGLLLVAINMNPLIKLDGYYAISEVLGYADIKEKATAYLSGVVRQRLFRLPVTVDYVPRRRRLAYLMYAIASGIYSYGLLLAFVTFAFRIFSHFLPVWGIVPTLALGVLVFRSRMRVFVHFARTVFLSKKDRLRSWVHGRHVSAAAVLASAFLLLVLPIWHQTVPARFVLEPVRQETVRTLVSGHVSQVFVQEGEAVRPEDPLIQMTSFDIESRREAAAEAFQRTGFERSQALLQHRALGDVQQSYLQAGVEQRLAGEQGDRLTARAPFAGTVVTPHMRDQLGTYLTAGSPVAQIVDTHGMRARIYIPEYAILPVQAGDSVRLLLDGTFGVLHSRVALVEPGTHPLPDAVEPVRKLDAGAPLEYFVANAELPNRGRLRVGMTGTASIVTARRSLAGLAWHNVREFVQRKVW